MNKKITAKRLKAKQSTDQSYFGHIRHYTYADYANYRVMRYNKVILEKNHDIFQINESGNTNEKILIYKGWKGELQ